MYGDMDKKAIKEKFDNMKKKEDVKIYFLNFIKFL